MFKFSDVLGTLMQSGMSGSTTSRMQHAMRAGGRSSQGSLGELLGRGGGMGDALAGLTGGASGGGIGGMLQGVLGDAGKALGGGNKLDLSGIVAATKGRPQLAAQIYAASLLAIEVDTPAERHYMQQLADDLHLSPEITSHLEKTVGM